MNRRTLIVFGIVFIVVVFIALFILSLSRSAQNRRQEVSREIVGKEIIPAIDVVEDPLVYDGLTIEVEAPITDWITKRSFTVSTGQRAGLLAGGEQSELLIITKNPVPLAKDTKDKELGLGETVNVRIKGKARIVNRVELGRALGLDLGESQGEGTDINLDDNEKIINWKEGSVILAESIEKL
ncbi:MAG: hypothetical protein UU21_C0001G0117 [Candidatus Levybacteria bacterium GW2011_GWA2_40_8]|nr:MAG: hypothetical protein UU21_C0001G0117 [Candidatus Levybacteria bacterium GW2011_GWA2_40_8]